VGVHRRRALGHGVGRQVDAVHFARQGRQLGRNLAASAWSNQQGADAFGPASAHGLGHLLFGENAIDMVSVLPKKQGVFDDAMGKRWAFGWSVGVPGALSPLFSSYLLSYMVESAGSLDTPSHDTGGVGTRHRTPRKKAPAEAGAVGGSRQVDQYFSFV